MAVTSLCSTLHQPAKSLRRSRLDGPTAPSSPPDHPRRPVLPAVDEGWVTHWSCDRDRHRHRTSRRGWPPQRAPSGVEPPTARSRVRARTMPSASASKSRPCRSAGGVGWIAVRALKSWWFVELQRPTQQHRPARSTFDEGSGHRRGPNCRDARVPRRTSNMCPGRDRSATRTQLLALFQARRTRPGKQRLLGPGHRLLQGQPTDVAER